MVGMWSGTPVIRVLMDSYSSDIAFVLGGSVMGLGEGVLWGSGGSVPCCNRYLCCNLPMDDVGKRVDQFLAESGFLGHESTEQFDNLDQHPVVGAVSQHLKEHRREGDVVLRRSRACKRQAVCGMQHNYPTVSLNIYI